MHLLRNTNLSLLTDDGCHGYSEAVPLLYRREHKHRFLDREFKIENKNRVELLDS